MFHVTERLLLRPAWPEDAEAIFGGIADEGVVRNLASAPWPYSREDAQTFVLRAQRDSYPRFLITARPPVRRPFRGQSGIGARAAKGRVQADRPDRKAP